MLGRTLHDLELPPHTRDEPIWRAALVYQLIYSLAGLFLGLVCIIGGIVLFLHGVLGTTSWTATFLGASSDISDAAPGAVLFIVGLFIVFITRFKVRLKDTGTSRELATRHTTPADFGPEYVRPDHEHEGVSEEDEDPSNEDDTRRQESCKRDDEFNADGFSPAERDALRLALEIHARVKQLANAQTDGEDVSFRGPISINDASIELQYEARPDQCHRSLSLTLADSDFRLWCECRGWMWLTEHGETVYSQRPHPDIEEKFEGDMDAFLAVAEQALAATA